MPPGTLFDCGGSQWQLAGALAEVVGGGISNLEDVSTLLRMHFNDGMCDGGRVMSAASAQRMRVDVGTAVGSREWIGSAGRGYGLGWWVPPTEEGVEPTLFQDGGAFGSVTWIDTAREYGVFVALAKYDDIIAARLGPLNINPGLTPVVNDIIDNPLP